MAWCVLEMAINGIPPVYEKNLPQASRARKTTWAVGPDAIGDEGVIRVFKFEWYLSTVPSLPSPLYTL